MVADVLSCRDEEGTALALSGPLFTDYDILRAELQADKVAQALRDQLAVGSAPDGWQLVEGLLLFNGRIFVPDTSSLWPLLLCDAHEASHEGVQKTLHRLRGSFYNSHAHRLVRNFVQGCAICQRNKTEHLHPAGLLQPLPVPSQVWSDITMDFVEGFSKVGGKSVVLTIVDRFSKMAHFMALSHPYSVQSVARAFFNNIVRLHGFPCSIVSDRDTVFTSHFWEELFKLAGVKLLRSLAFHPQTDGQSESPTASLSCICGAWLVIVLVHGCSGCLGQSFASTLHSSLHFEPHRLRWSMAEHLQHWFPTLQALPGWLQLIASSRP